MKQLSFLRSLRRQLSLSLLTALVCTLTIDEVNAQTIRYVKPDGSGNGSSWATASANLQAIINASSAGDQVWVAAGTYKPSSCTTCSATDRMMSFSMKNGVALYGGFVGTESTLSERPVSVSLAQPSSTTLSGDLGTLNDRNDNSVHIIVNTDISNTAVLDGFVITGGNLDAGSTGVDYNTLQGGGMRNLRSSPAIRNCFFTGNVSSFGGGGNGLYNDAASSPVLTNCTFSENTGGYAAAISSSGSTTLVNCIFTSNTAFSTAPVIISKGTLTNCTFSSNNGNSGPNGGATGGALNVGEGSVLTNCLFVLNYVVGDGGALAAYQSTVTNCTFRGNRSSSGGAGIPNTYGGAVYARNTSFINCSFTGNQATTRGNSGGGAAFTTGGQFVNCSFSRNFCDRTGGAVFSTNTSFVNCAIWGNTPNGVASDGTIPMTYTDTQDNTPGTGNFSLDPLFIDAASDDLRLRACSPAIDKGNNSANSTTSDLNNSPRLVRQIDLGAYEFQGTPQAPPTITQQPAAYASIPQGGTLSTSVSTSGSVSAYQWYKDGAPISGATSATLTVSNLNASNQGRYYVVVTGSCNSVASTELILVVNTGMYTVKAGRWDDASVWSLNRVPVSGDTVRIKHLVSVPSNYVARARQLSYDPGQTVQLQNGSKLVAQ